MAFARVIAFSSVVLLEEADHVSSAKTVTRRLQSLTVDFNQSQSHVSPHRARSGDSLRGPASAWRLRSGNLKCPALILENNTALRMQLIGKHDQVHMCRNLGGNRSKSFKPWHGVKSLTEKLR